MRTIFFRGMKKLFRLSTGLFVGLLAFQLLATSCNSYCPAVSGTGNSASHKKRVVKRKYCAGVSSTGNKKVKVKRKKEDGLFSKKMNKEVHKHNNLQLTGNEK